MGQNQAHRELFDELNSRRIEEAMMRPRPISLTPAELDVENDPPWTLREPIPVRSWVRFTETAVDVRAEAFECNHRGVHVRWVAPDGSRRDAWVYAGAVRRITPDENGKVAMRDRDLSAFHRAPRQSPADAPEVGGPR